MLSKILLLVLSVFLFSACSLEPPPLPDEEQEAPTEISDSVMDTEAITEERALFTEPLADALARVTKKPFGIHVSPADSPASPEKFSGYHTGVDFEIFPAEADVAVSVSAICAGPIRLKRFATGYGGVAVQECALNKEQITIIYGHLDLSSITTELGQVLNHGQQIGILGQRFSAETDGERQHLHLGIHKGANINLLGYVQTPDQLTEWIDPVPLMR